MPGFPRCVAVPRDLENPNIRIHPERSLATNRTGLVELPSVGGHLHRFPHLTLGECQIALIS